MRRAGERAANAMLRFAMIVTIMMGVGFLIRLVVAREHGVTLALYGGATLIGIGVLVVGLVREQNSKSSR